MNTKARRTLKVTACAALLLLLPYCYCTPMIGGNGLNQPTQLSAWLVYWDIAAGDAERKQLDQKLGQLCYFAAYFDRFGRVFVPAELSNSHAALKRTKTEYETYLTFVNDWQRPDGTVALKDLTVIRCVLADSDAMERHINNVVALALRGGYDGIEIDYERIWKDEELAARFNQFIAKLSARAKTSNLKVRVVLEPGALALANKYPRGPDYVVMLYNLYGLHSGPGPKANKDFILNSLGRMQSLPGRKTAAFATGGCLWGSNGEKAFLTEAQAKALAEHHHSKQRRDDASQCLVFEYAEHGTSYQIWYADAATLDYWITLAKEQGQNSISLWRLGGNTALELAIAQPTKNKPPYR